MQLFSLIVELTPQSEGALPLLAAVQQLVLRSGNETLMADMYVRMGTVFLDRRETASAIMSLRSAIALNPRSTAGYNNLAGVLRLMGRFDDARRALEAGLRRCSTEMHQINQVEFIYYSFFTLIINVMEKNIDYYYYF